MADLTLDAKTLGPLMREAYWDDMNHPPWSPDRNWERKAQTVIDRLLALMENDKCSSAEDATDTTKKSTAVPMKVTVSSGEQPANPAENTSSA